MAGRRRACARRLPAPPCARRCAHLRERRGSGRRSALCVRDHRPRARADEARLRTGRGHGRLGRPRRAALRYSLRPGTRGTHERRGVAADAIITFPVSPDFPSLNLAQAVLLVGYEWRKASAGRDFHFRRDAVATRDARRWSPCSRTWRLRSTWRVSTAGAPEKRGGITRNMRDMLHRMALNKRTRAHFPGALRAISRAMKS